MMCDLGIQNSFLKSISRLTNGKIKLIPNKKVQSNPKTS